MRKISANLWSAVAGSFSMSHEAEITLKCENMILPFHVLTKKSNDEIICGRDLFRELEIQLDFKNNFIGWQAH